MTSIGRLALRVCRRLAWEIKCIISPNGLATFRLADGSRFDYPIKSAIGYGLSMASFEVGEIAFMRRSLKPGDVVFDVGANGGVFTVIAAKQVGPGGHVYAFEPGQRELRLLRHNIALNNLTNVAVIGRAVGNETGTAQFAVASDGALSSLGKTSHPQQKVEKWEMVEIITLDEFIRQQNIPQVDFIKVDVEGAEKLVLEGAANLIATNPQLRILFESYIVNTSAFNYTPNVFLAELIKSGLSVHYIKDTGLCPVTSTDDPQLGTQFYNFAILPRN